MTYVDGFVLAVPRANKDKYIAHAHMVSDVFKENGAVRVTECMGDDVPDGQVTSFPMAVKCKPDETVWFSWIEWPSRAVRDEAMPRILADPRFENDGSPMPLDGKRMIFGGFEMMLDQ